MAVGAAVLLTAGVVVLFVVEECADNKTISYKTRRRHHVGPTVSARYPLVTSRMINGIVRKPR